MHTNGSTRKRGGSMLKPAFATESVSIAAMQLSQHPQWSSEGRVTGGGFSRCSGSACGSRTSCSRTAKQNPAGAVHEA
jgi:hypothetical protein